MIEPFKMGYTAIGGLGVFILGMKYLSDSLQALSGDMIRKAISSVTTNRILAVVVGLFVTTFVQSSSITTVMVVGESGTGKELVARALHNLGSRAGAYVPLNAGAIAESLADAELFGHRRGALLEVRGS